MVGDDGEIEALRWWAGAFEIEALEHGREGGREAGSGSSTMICIGKGGGKCKESASPLVFGMFENRP